MTVHRLPTYFVSHGGGPWPYMDGPFRRNFDELEASLVRMRAELADAPKAVLVVSGHWEQRAFTVSSAARPGMEYDYSGFPAHLYEIVYAAPGAPALAKRVATLLADHGLPSGLDAERGLDHGTFSIMKPLYPDEDIPVVQLSLHAGFDPALHIAAGKALAPLRDERVLIVGSGLSYHNLPAMRDDSGYEPSRRFDDWLRETVIDAPAEEREARLLSWADAPCARAVHPREDHLLPLMVAVGAAGDSAGALSYHQDDFLGGLTVSSFRFGAPPAGEVA
ncbi:class III extradiol ring-cleavage dioxygenase [Sphingomonas sp.]|uniref:DODA-type extradiol aromatic ring-opening family dioxygenase n=1 Tax=Sphingomonas sp. TaxID=28214 RepID=UPI002CCE8082|nr:class III extradiol ring-cleavage dioxygenase [Sphingomonas sp.]HTG38887.1 class III extradiol ring-cleavage dioxygenase [Sphingomonas sp.]